MDLGTLMATLGVDTTGILQAQREFTSFEKEVNATVKTINKNLKTSGQAMKQFGRDASKYLTVPLTAFGVGSAKTFADFESSLAKVTGLVGVAGEQVNTWGEDILKLAPQLAQAPTALADGLFFVTSAGIKGAEAMDVLKASGKAASAGLGEVQVVADLVTSAMNAYGKENLSASMATDILTAAVREGKAQAPELAAAMGSVLPIASQMGVSFDQVAAATAAMTRTGTNAATANMQLRQILNSLLKPTNQAEEALNGMGTSSAALRKTIKEDGLLKALMDIRTLTKKYGEETVATVFPNIRALAGVLDLMGKSLDSNIQIFDSVEHSTGSLNKAFKAAAETTNFKFNQAVAAGKVTLTEFGKEISSAAAPLLEKLVAALQGVSNWFKNLSSTGKQTVLIIGGILAVVGPVSIALGVLATSVLPGLVAIGGKAIVMFNALKLAIVTNPIGVFAAVLATVVGTMLLFKNNTKDAAEAQKQLNDEIEKSNGLWTNTIAIDDRIKVIDSLNKRQLLSLKSSIIKQIEAEEDLTLNIKQEAKKRLEQDTQLQEMRTKIAEAGEGVIFDNLRRTLTAQSNLRKKELTKDLQVELNNNKTRLNALNSYINEVNARIKTINKTDATKNNNLEVQKILKQVAVKEEEIARLNAALGTSFDAVGAKSDVYGNAIQDLLKNNLEPTSTEVQNLVSKLKALEKPVDDSSTDFMNMGAQLAVINTNAKLLGASYDGTGAKINLFNSILQKGLQDGKLTTAQIQELNNKLQGLKQTVADNAIANQLGWIGVQSSILGEDFNSAAATANVYQQALKNLWDQGLRPGDSAFDTMKNNFKNAQTAAEGFATTEEQINAASQAFSNMGTAINGTAGAYFQWVSQVLGTIPSLITAFASLTAAQTAETTAAAGNAVANATAGAAKAPWPIAAFVVAANVAAVIAALSSVPKMAKGGIIPNGYPNDSFPAMLQSGEAVIPLDRLDRMMSGKSSGGNGVSELKLRGRTLQAAIDAQLKYEKLK